MEIPLCSLASIFASTCVIVTPSGKEFSPDRALTFNAGRLELLGHEKARFDIPLECPAPLLVRHATHQFYVYRGKNGAKMALSVNTITHYDDGRLSRMDSCISIHEYTDKTALDHMVLKMDFDERPSDEESARAMAIFQNDHDYNEKLAKVVTLEHYHYTSGHRVTLRVSFKNARCH